MDTTNVTLKPFVNRKLELSVVDGVILWENRVVVPSLGQELLLQELHPCHPGITRMKMLAHMFVWWPQLDSDIHSNQLLPQCLFTLGGGPLLPGTDLAGPFLGHM